MKRVWYSTLAAFAMLVGAPAAFGQTNFSLGFDADGPDHFAGSEGDPWAANLTATLSAEGTGTGAQGWSISMTADNAEITAITTTGTDVDALFSGGFRKSELTTKGKDDCAGHNGAVSAVVLSFTLPVTLPAPASPAVKSNIAKLALSGSIPPGGGVATARYVNNCQGAGQPVQNNITQDGATVAPALGSKDIVLTKIESFCNKKLVVGFSDHKVSSPTPYTGIIDSGDGLCTGGGGTAVFEVAEGDMGNFHIFANISSNNADGGGQGWSFSIALDGEMSFGPSGVTTAGTTVDALFAGGFKKTEIIDPSNPTNAGQRGCVSAVVLSFTLPVVLPVTGTESVLDMNLKASSPPTEGADVVGKLSFKNGLRGAGQPVQNAITVGGATQEISNLPTAEITIAAHLRVLTKGNFIRGNANDDAKVDIADPVYIINELFRSGPATACKSAADANDDGQEDAADAVYLVTYLFIAGSPPPAPFGATACSTDPTDDTGDADPSNDLSCLPGSATSCP